MKLYIFWHLCTIFKYRKRSKEIIERQWKLLNNSNIINLCECINLVVIGKMNYKIIQEIIKHPKIRLIKHTQTGHELETSREIYNFSKLNDAIILYIHNKGVTKSSGKIKVCVD